MTVVLPIICEDKIVDLPPVRAVYKRVTHKSRHKSIMSAMDTGSCYYWDVHDFDGEEIERLKKQIENLKKQVITRDEELKKKGEEIDDLKLENDQLKKVLKKKARYDINRRRFNMNFDYSQAYRFSEKCTCKHFIIIKICKQFMFGRWSVWHCLSLYPMHIIVAMNNLFMTRSYTVFCCKFK